MVQDWEQDRYIYYCKGYTCVNNTNVKYSRLPWRMHYRLVKTIKLIHKEAGKTETFLKPSLNVKQLRVCCSYQFQKLSSGQLPITNTHHIANLPTIKCSYLYTNKNIFYFSISFSLINFQVNVQRHIIDILCIALIDQI